MRPHDRFVFSLLTSNKRIFMKLDSHLHNNIKWISFRVRILSTFTEYTLNYNENFVMESIKVLRNTSVYKNQSQH